MKLFYIGEEAKTKHFNKYFKKIYIGNEINS